MEDSVSQSASAPSQQKPSIDVAQLQAGDYLSEIKYYRIQKVNPKTLILIDQVGEEIKMDKTLLAGVYSASQYQQEESIGRGELSTLLLQIGQTVFTANFTKKVKESDIKTKLLDTLKDSQGQYLEPAKIEKNLKKISKSLLQGEERTLIGHIVKVNTALGWSLVVDLEIPSDQYQLRQIDHRTINWIIFKGIKYTVK